MNTTLIQLSITLSLILSVLGLLIYFSSVQNTAIEQIDQSETVFSPISSPLNTPAYSPSPATESLLEFPAEMRAVLSATEIVGEGEVAPSGAVYSGTLNGVFYLAGNYQNLPPLFEEEMYSGWLVSSQTNNRVSTGIIRSVNGKYMTSFQSETYLGQYDYFEVTRENTINGSSQVLLKGFFEPI